MSDATNPEVIIPANRRRLAQVVRTAGDVISVDAVMRALKVDRTAAAKSLARWREQGWLRRVGRGSYVPAGLDTLEDPLVLSDPWILVPALFDPAYISGRTAAQHWDLTEQIFNDVVVMTTRPVRDKAQRRHGTLFSLKHIAEAKMFGTTPLWRGHSRIAIADVHRTLIDMLDDPELGGGIQHVADCFANYLKRADRDDARLIDYAMRLHNGAVFKRLGFLAEREPKGSALVAPCLERLTKGNAKLDPAAPSPRLITRWRLWVPNAWLHRTKP